MATEKEEVTFSPHFHALIWQESDKWTGIIKKKTSWDKMINGVRHVYPSQHWSFSYEHGPFDSPDAARLYFADLFEKEQQLIKKLNEEQKDTYRHF